jgi:dipeptidyl aminopeptidase/acylaminoacyl peptidase
MVAAETVRLAAVMPAGVDLYWLEGRPAEGGRQVVVRRTPDGHVADVTPPGFNARTRVHEYGGGSYVAAEGAVYFANFADQRIYAQPLGRAPTPITPARALRYADLVFDRRRGRLIGVREDHTRSDREAVNALVDLDPRPGADPEGGRVLVAGNDFYAAPCVSPDGSRMAWLTWNHPQMPWDGTELWVGAFRPDGTVAEAQRVAGGPRESIFQPQWSPDGTLHFVSDRTGWWNLYRRRAGEVEPLLEMEAEFGKPQWVFGMSTYAFTPQGEIVCAYTQGGNWYLGRLHPDRRALTPIPLPYTAISGLRTDGRAAFFVGGAPAAPPSIVRLDLRTHQAEVVRRSGTPDLDPAYVSAPEPVEFPTTGGRTAHGLFYAPKNPDYVAPEGERPPLVVFSHGGPTSMTTGALDLALQYWTSRGIAVLDVNYGGSTGYGRAYRERLRGRWGVVDVDDCVNGARHLVARGRVDGERLAIRGGSAGGYTTLCALTFRDFFDVGASYFGVSDPEALALETHKFESRYLDGLIGPYPERKELYRERAAIHHVDRLSCPVIFLQGAEDAVVPPAQAERMVNALREKGLPVAYLLFEGEQHGFRRQEHIARALNAELYFYARILGFELAEPVEPVAIENL